MYRYFKYVPLLVSSIILGDEQAEDGPGCRLS